MSRSVIPLPQPRATEGALADDAAQAQGTDLAKGLRRVSPSLIWVRYISGAIFWACAIAFCVAWHVLVSYLEWSAWLHYLPVAVYLYVVQSIVLLPRRTRAIGYMTREDDIVFRQGLISRSLTVMPYGRVQDIEIDEGLLERSFGLSSLTLKSAGGVTSSMSIPGLTRAESERIRDLITREAGAKMAAL